MNESSVDGEEVEHIADLARIDLDEQERERYADQFADILSYFETLEAVPVVEDNPELVNVMRDDEIRESLAQAEALANAPDEESGYFRGPDVS